MSGESEKDIELSWFSFEDGFVEVGLTEAELVEAGLVEPESEVAGRQSDSLHFRNNGASPSPLRKSSRASNKRSLCQESIAKGSGANFPNVSPPCRTRILPDSREIFRKMSGKKIGAHPNWVCPVGF